MSREPSTADDSERSRPREVAAPSASPDGPRWGRREWWTVAALTLLALALRVFRIDAQSLWFDEVLTLRFAQLPVADLLYDLAVIDVHPPLFYLVLKTWASVGESELHLRMLSALCGTLTVPLLYAIGARLGGHATGALAALLLAVSPLHVRYAQEVRSYALLILATTTALWGLAQILTRPSAAPPEPRGGESSWRRWIPWLAYVVGAAVAIHTHSVAVFLPAIACLLAVIWWATAGRRDPRFLWSWIAANAAILVLWTPWLPFVFKQTVVILADTWMQTPTPKSAAQTVAEIYGPGGGTRPAALLLAALASLGAWSWRRRPYSLLLVLGFAAGVPLLTFLVSYWRPIFLGRTIIWSSVPFYLLLAAGCLALRYRAVSAILAVGLLGFQTAELAHYYRAHQREPWNEIAAYVEDRLAPGDQVIFHPQDAEMPFRYYCKHCLGDLSMAGITIDDPPIPRRVDEVELLPIERLGERVAEHDRTWLVMRASRVLGGGRVRDEMRELAHEADYYKSYNLEVVLFEHPRRR